MEGSRPAWYFSRIHNADLAGRGFEEGIMSSQALIEFMEKELDEALSFIAYFKSYLDVFDPRFYDKKRRYEAMIESYHKVLDVLGDIDKTKYTIVFSENNDASAILPLKHKIERVKDEVDE